MPKGELNKISIRFDDTEKFRFGESLWATEINFDTFKLANIPFFTEDYGLNDLVLVDDTLTILERVEQCSRTKHISYSVEGDEQQIQERFVRIREYLQRAGIETESAILGYISLALPLDMDDDRLSLALAACDDELGLVDVDHCRSLVYKMPEA